MIKMVFSQGGKQFLIYINQGQIFYRDKFEEKYGDVRIYPPNMEDYRIQHLLKGLGPGDKDIMALELTAFKLAEKDDNKLAELIIQGRKKEGARLILRRNE